MIIFYILLVAYIFAINFYSFLLVKTARDKEKADESQKQSAPLSEFNNEQSSTASPKSDKPTEKNTGKLCIAGILGGAITVYVCMFLFKYRRSDLLLMVLMPLLGVLNVYFLVLVFRSGFSFFLFR